MKLSISPRGLEFIQQGINELRGSREKTEESQSSATSFGEETPKSPLKSRSSIRKIKPSSRSVSSMSPFFTMASRFKLEKDRNFNSKDLKRKTTLYNDYKISTQRASIKHSPVIKMKKTLNTPSSKNFSPGKLAPILPAISLIIDRTFNRRDSIFKKVEKIKIENSVLASSRLENKEKKRSKEKVKIADDFKIFKESIEDFKPSNNFLKKRLGKIYNRASTKKKLGEIEYKIKKGKFGVKKDESEQKKITKIIKMNSSINFFNKTVKKGMKDFKEYNKELREVRHLKKLSYDHTKFKNQHDKTLTGIRDSIRNLKLLQSPKPKNLEEINKVVQGVDKEFKKTLSNLKISYRKTSENRKLFDRRAIKSLDCGTGHLKFDYGLKKLAKNFYDMPNCFRVSVKRKKGKKGSMTSFGSDF